MRKLLLLLLEVRLMLHLRKQLALMVRQTAKTNCCEEVDAEANVSRMILREESLDVWLHLRVCEALVQRPQSEGLAHVLQ